MSAAELILSIGSAPPTPAPGRVSLFAGTDNRLYVQDSSGNVRKLTVANGELVIAAGDTLTVPPGGGSAIVQTGNPSSNQIGIWSGSNAQQGDPNLTWDGATLDITGALHVTQMTSTILNNRQLFSYSGVLTRNSEAATGRTILTVQTTAGQNAAFDLWLTVLYQRYPHISDDSGLYLFTAGGSRAGSEAFTAPVLRSSYTVRGTPTAPTLAWSSATSPSTPEHHPEPDMGNSGHQCASSPYWRGHVCV
ncbi:MAG: hypothetical protein HC914_19095, partial [Chloroflexaceae bacterium]|nr:hypothetical protein [Chloroflexaceae bacterium]